jgi:uncharacterized iron-regulated protein
MQKTLLTRALLLLLFALTLTGCSISKAMRIENREVIDVKTMIGELRDTPLVFVGERHNEPSHHELQLDILKTLKGEGKALAIGMEMFEDSSQRALDAWSAGKVPEAAFQKVFEASWRNIPWWLYREILVYARDNRIPIIALNAPRPIVQAVSQSGLASLSEQELRRLPAGLDLGVSDAYIDFIRSSYPSHGRNGEAFRFICEAQMLRNRVMARHISDYLLRNPERVMVVIAGGGHARHKGGIPEELAQIPSKIVLPPILGLNADTVTRDDGDYLLVEPFSWLADMP